MAPRGDEEGGWGAAGKTSCTNDVGEGNPTAFARRRPVNGGGAAQPRSTAADDDDDDDDDDSSDTCRMRDRACVHHTRSPISRETNRAIHDFMMPKANEGHGGGRQSGNVS